MHPLHLIVDYLMHATHWGRRIYSSHCGLVDYAWARKQPHLRASEVEQLFSLCFSVSSLSNECETGVSVNSFGWVVVICSFLLKKSRLLGSKLGRALIRWAIHIECGQLDCYVKSSILLKQSTNRNRYFSSDKCEPPDMWTSLTMDQRTYMMVPSWLLDLTNGWINRISSSR